MAAFYPHRSALQNFSRYAARMLQAYPELGDRIAQAQSQPLTPQYMVERLDCLCLQDLQNGGFVSAHEAPHAEHLAILAQSLRLLRIEVFCLLMQRDLSGDAPLEEVMQTMSALADLVLQRGAQALDIALRAQYGTPISAHDETPQTLGIIGMGKLGGRELNVSSDIDVIFIYGEEGQTSGGTRGTLSNQDYFLRLARQLIRMLDEHTAQGYVFRIDTRLRPNGHEGSLVCSLKSLQTYLVKQGRTWERYAWLKNRLINAEQNLSSQVLARQLNTCVSAFVYPHSTYGTASKSPIPPALPSQDASALIDAIRSMHIQIQQEEKRRTYTGLGSSTHNTMGARESSRDNIKLGRGGIREIEFSVQVLQLLYGHTDPNFRSPSTLHALHYAATHHYIDTERAAQLQQAYDFLRRIEHRLQYVDDAQTHTLHPSKHGQERKRLAHSLGYPDYPHFYQALEVHRQRVMQHFDALFTSYPVSKTPASSISPRSFGCWGNIVIALWMTYTHALKRVLHAIARSPWAAQHLARHPEVLPTLLEPRAACFQADWERFKNQLATQLACATPEEQMDLLRNAHQAEMFQIFLSDLAGMVTVETIGDRLSDLAHAVLDVALQAVWKQLPERYHPTPDIAMPRFCIIAYGKLGGKELGYAGDLDLVFIYDDPDASGSERYSAFARRLMNYLTSATGAGILFDIDLRLRPGGASGLLVTSMEAFRRYQQRSGERANTADLWEHQALTRARYCAGDPDIGAEFEALRIHILKQKREAAALAHDIAAMRQRVLAEHLHHNTLFDLKYDQGGMMDIEFIVQYIVLLHARNHAELLQNSGNIALLHTAAKLGLIPTDEANAVSDAYRVYRALQHQLRLEGISIARVPPEQVTWQRQAVLGLSTKIFD
jgi:glutamate-ammonia-ligase adenylyltransferase